LSFPPNGPRRCPACGAVIGMCHMPECEPAQTDDSERIADLYRRANERAAQAYVKHRKGGGANQ